MEFSNVKIVKCPHCGGLHSSEFPELSTDTLPLDFLLWTDGVRTGFMINRLSRPFYYCTYGRCEKTFWFSDAEVVYRIDPASCGNTALDEEQKKINALYEELSLGESYTGLDNCYQAINEGIAGDIAENWKWLRKFTWEKTIDCLRGMMDCEFVSGSKQILSERHADNLMELRKILDITQDEERLEAIEIHRQRGEFEQAMALIDFDWQPDSLQMAEYQRDLIAQKDMMLRSILLKRFSRKRMSF